MAGPDKVVARGRWAMRGIISLAVLGMAGYVLLSGHYDADSRTWATGVIGVVIGYWLR